MPSTTAASWMAADPLNIDGWPDTLPSPVDEWPLAGGSIARTSRLRLSDGRDVVVKRGAVHAELEAEGLLALAGAGAPTPAVLHASDGLLVLEYVSTSSPDGRALGHAVAELHATTGSAFGWHRDNVIGPLPQPNPTTGDWPTFYVEHRLAPLLDALPTTEARRLEQAMAGPLPRLLDHDPPPSLVHGDLWSGNIVDATWLIDPAVHYADRELDLAFLALFGGAPAGFTEGYAERWPLDDGWEERRPALQLWHLLVHVRLFGGSYVDAVRTRLDTLGL